MSRIRDFGVLRLVAALACQSVIEIESGDKSPHVKGTAVNLETIRRAKHARPSRPFEIRMAGCRRIVVREPMSVAIGRFWAIVMKDEGGDEIDGNQIVSVDISPYGAESAPHN
ncbi:MAG: hypothetical protein O3B01_03710 [Planctomycetota bacterium]|nr:hypothetical protein [Planctomycetota bacterium]